MQGSLLGEFFGWRDGEKPRGRERAGKRRANVFFFFCLFFPLLSLPSFLSRFAFSGFCFPFSSLSRYYTHYSLCIRNASSLVQTERRRKAPLSLPLFKPRQ
jgi:hypothetical protein